MNKLNKPSSVEIGDEEETDADSDVDERLHPVCRQRETAVAHQAAGEAARQQGHAREDYYRLGDEQTAQQEQLARRVRRMRADELGKEGDEEEEHFGIQHVHQDALAVEAGLRHTVGGGNERVLFAVEEGLHAQIEQISRPEEFQHSERRRRLIEQQGQSQAGGQRVEHQASTQSGGENNPRALSPGDALRDDEKDVRPRHQGQQHRRT